MVTAKGRRRRRRLGHRPWTVKKKRKSQTPTPPQQPPPDDPAPTPTPEPWEKYLEDTYFNPKRPGSFQGPNKIHKEIEREGKFDVDKDDLKQWLQNQPAYSLNKSVRRNFRRSPVVVSGIDDQFEMDLLSLAKFQDSNDGHTFVLAVIDVFSRHAWFRALKNKTPKSVIVELKDIFSEGRIPRRMRSDRGSEFTAAETKNYFKSIGVHQMFTSNEKQANYVERLIKTLKSRIMRYLRHNKTDRYVDVLQDFADSYNNTSHRSINMKPSDVNSSNEKMLWWKLYKPKRPYTGRKNRPKIQKFKLKTGDLVRISYVRKSFQREYDNRWSGEIFKVVGRVHRNVRGNGNGNYPPLYKLTDYAGEEVTGTFYEFELQKVTVDPEDIFEIESELKTRREGKEVFVKFKYWPTKFNRWVNKEDIITR